METFSALLAFCARNSPHKGQWRGALIFSLICVWIKGWVNDREAGDLRRYRAHYDVTVINYCYHSPVVAYKIYSTQLYMACYHSVTNHVIRVSYNIIIRILFYKRSWCQHSNRIGWKLTYLCKYELTKGWIPNVYTYWGFDATLTHTHTGAKVINRSNLRSQIRFAILCRQQHCVSWVQRTLNFPNRSKCFVLFTTRSASAAVEEGDLMRPTMSDIAYHVHV